MSGLVNWFNVELWGPMWPNLAASVVWAVPAFAWQHRRISKRLDAHHAAIHTTLGRIDPDPQPQGDRS